MKDLFDKCVNFKSRPKRLLEDEHALATELFSSVSPPQNAGPWINVAGKKMLQFSTNDYLGLAMNEEVSLRALEKLQRYGISSPMGSRLLTGTTEDHLELERQVAEFKRSEASLTFVTGSSAMMGALACLADRRDLLIMDQYAHASLVCGAKISGAQVRYFRHNDMEELEKALHGVDARGTAIVVDGIYSMQGDMAPLKEIVALKKKYGVRLFLDDAHGTGVCGDEGRGTAAHFGVEEEIDLHMGTFSKAVGTIGGFVSGDRVVVDYIKFNAPTFLFTKAMPLCVVAATQHAIDLLRRGDDLRRRLWKNKERLQSGLVRLGFSIGNTQSPITPINANGTGALSMAHALRTQYGIWAVPVIYPGVHLGASIVRLIPTALHTAPDIDRLLHALESIREGMEVERAPSTT